MIVTCNEEYWRYMPKLKPPEAPCGKTYDDAECLVLCPHEPLPPKLTEAEQEELLKKILEAGYPV